MKVAPPQSADFWYNIQSMHQEQEKRLLIDVARLAPEGEDLAGEADIVDYEQEFVHPFGGVRYRLHAQQFGTELLVMGHLEQDFTLACSRCGKDFDTTVHVDDFTVSVEVGEEDEWADITDDARESVILAMPTYPVCDEACPGILQEAEPPADDRWNALDGLKV